VEFEKECLQGTGGTFAVLKHLEESEKQEFIVEMLCIEGFKSSEIEGELLQRESLQSSIQKNLGIKTDRLFNSEVRHLGCLTKVAKNLYRCCKV
jgi:hypothetical protein